MLSSQAQVKAKTYEVLLKSWVRKEIEGEDELVRKLEEENKKAILLLKIIYLRWLNKNQTKGTFRHVVIELDCPETANQLCTEGFFLYFFFYSYCIRV